MRYVVLSLLLLLPAVADAQDKPNIYHDCHGNALEACYVIVQGEIEAGASARLDALMDEGVEAYKVLLDSPGGDLSEGLAVGRVIRKHGFETRIGSFRTRDGPGPAECLSACAYAFLGGTQRIVRDGSRIGFHRFVFGPNAFLEGAGGIAVGQRLSASVIAYMVEMGTDARLFAVASETAFEDMYFPDRIERSDYDIETALGFAPFFMEPFGQGVIVASRRRGPTYAYDRVDQLSAYCRGGQARVLLTVGGADQFIPDPGPAHVGLSDTLRPGWGDWRELEIPTEDVRTWTGPAGAYIELSFDPRALPIGDEARVFRATLSAARAAGGPHGATVPLEPMDRAMLRSAFRLCR